MNGNYKDLSVKRKKEKTNEVPEGLHLLRKAVFITRSKVPTSTYTDLLMQKHDEYGYVITTCRAQTHNRKQRRSWERTEGFVCIAEGPMDFVTKYKAKFHTNMMPDFDDIHRAFYTDDFEMKG